MKCWLCRDVKMFCLHLVDSEYDMKKVKIRRDRNDCDSIFCKYFPFQGKNKFRWLLQVVVICKSMQKSIQMHVFSL